MKPLQRLSSICKQHRRPVIHAARADDKWRHTKVSALISILKGSPQMRQTDAPPSASSTSTTLFPWGCAECEIVFLTFSTLPHGAFFLSSPPQVCFPDASSLPLTAARTFGTNAYRASIAGCEYMWRCICISLLCCLGFSHLLRSTEKSFTLCLSQKTLLSLWKLAWRR